MAIKTSCFLSSIVSLVFFVMLPSHQGTAQDSVANQPVYRVNDTMSVPQMSVEPGNSLPTMAPQPADGFPSLVVPEKTMSEGDSKLGEGFAGPIVTTACSLLVVLAIFGALVWVSRRYGSAGTPAGALPEDVVKNLGSAPIDAKTRVTFLKVGQRILVIGQTATGDPQTLSEITDAGEVDRLTNRCMGRPEIIGRRNGIQSGVDAKRRDLAAG